MRRIVILAVWAAAACAQPSFEVASIKRSGPQSVRGWDGGPGTRDPGQYKFGRATVLDFIYTAYNVQTFQISSGIPLDAERFDLIAKVPTDTTKEQFREMMKAFLAERFHLKVHIISKEFPAYDLIVANGGPKLTPAADPPSGRPGMSANYTSSGAFTVVQVRGRQATMDQFAGILQRPGEPPVRNRTALAGKYDISLDYTIETANSAAGGPVDVPPAPDLAAALRQQLGLQLVSVKAPYDVVVVDSVDRVPTEN